MHRKTNIRQINTHLQTSAYKIFQFQVFKSLSSLYLEKKMDLKSLAPSIPKQMNDKAQVNGDTNSRGGVSASI